MNLQTFYWFWGIFPLFLKNCITVSVATTVVASPIMATIKVTIPLLISKLALKEFNNSERKPGLTSVEYTKKKTVKTMVAVKPVMSPVENPSP